MSSKATHQTLESCRLLWSYARGHWWNLGFIAATGLLLLAPDLLAAHLIRSFVNGKLVHSPSGWLQTIGAIILLFAAKGVVAFFSNRQTIRLSVRVTSAVHVRLLKLCLELDLSKFQTLQPGEVLSTLAISASRVKNVLLALVRIFLVEGMMIAAYMGAIYLLSPPLFMVMAAMVLPYGTILFVQHRIILKMSPVAVQRRARWAGLVEDTLRNFERIRGIHAEGAQWEVLRRETLATAAAEERLEVRKALVGPFLELLVGVGLILVIAVGVVGYAGETLLPGDILAAAGLALLVVRPLNRVVSAAGTIRHDFAHLDRVRAMEALVDEGNVPGPTGSKMQFVRGVPAVTLQDVSYSFLDGSPGLVSMNLSCQGPGLVAITGPSGAGKSTLARVVAGLAVPDCGSVRLSMKQGEEGRVVLSPQGGGLVDRPLLHAVSFPETEGDVARALGLLQTVGLKNLVKEGDHEGRRIGSGAGLLSQGECRRLALANALYHQPEILILDEPFAGVHEREVERLAGLLSDLSQERLLLVVSHCAHVLQSAREVHFIVGGSVLCSGPHEQLLNVSKPYRDNFLSRVETGREEPECSF